MNKTILRGSNQQAPRHRVISDPPHPLVIEEEGHYAASPIVDNPQKMPKPKNNF